MSTRALATILALGAVGCARAQVGVGPFWGASEFGDSGPGYGADAGGWLRGERIGIFAVAEGGGFTFGNDADAPRWLGVDVRGRTVLYQAGHFRVPFVYGGGAGYEVGYLSNALISGIAEIGVEGDVGPLVLGLRARERAGFYVKATNDLLSWFSSTSAIIDLGVRF